MPGELTLILDLVCHPSWDSDRQKTAGQRYSGAVVQDSLMSIFPPGEGFFSISTDGVSQDGV